MALKVDDILITDKNVFVLSGERQMVADVESATTTGDYAESIDVNPWNLYNSDGSIISNLYDSSDFSLRTQILKTSSQLSPNNKNRHEGFYMANSTGYRGMCQVEDVGYSLTDFTSGNFSAEIDDDTEYVANGDFCMYYYLSSLKEDENNFITPDLAYDSERGAQYINEYPLGKYYSDFGDNDLDENGTLIDRPTIYADSVITKYFYDDKYSVNGKTDDGKTITFDGMRSYYGIGYTGDVLYLVYRNNLIGKSLEYGTFRPKDESKVEVKFDLNTLAHMSGLGGAVTFSSNYGKYSEYVSDSYSSVFKPYEMFGKECIVLQTFHPTDESFVLYAIASSTDAVARKAAAVYKFCNCLAYVPRVGGFANARFYSSFTTPTGDREKPGNLFAAMSGEFIQSSQYYDKTMSFIELEHSVIIGSHANGSINVVSKEYGYVNRVDDDENSSMSYDPFLQPFIGSYPDSTDYRGQNSQLPHRDERGRSDIFYNGKDILALKKYGTANGNANSGDERIYLSKEYTDSNGIKCAIGNYFASTFNPSVSALPSDTSFAEDSEDTKTVDGFEPLFDNCTVEKSQYDEKLEIIPETNTSGMWAIDTDTKRNGYNCIKIFPHKDNVKTYATLDVTVEEGSTLTMSFDLSLVDFANGHTRFIIYDSVNGGAFAVKQTYNNTYQSQSNIVKNVRDLRMSKAFETCTLELDGGNHTIKIEYSDYCGCDGKRSYGLLSNFWLKNKTTGDVIVEACDIDKNELSHFVLKSKSTFALHVGSYVFIQFADCTLGLCHISDIFKTKNAIRMEYCGPCNSSQMLSGYAKGKFDGKLPICMNAHLLVQSDSYSLISNAVNNTKFPLSEYKGLDRFFYSDASLAASYSVSGTDDLSGFSTFSLMPFGRSTKDALITATYGNTSVSAERLGIDSLEYVNGHMVGRTLAMPWKIMSAETALHNCGVCITKWNPKSGYSVCNSGFFSDEPSSVSLGGMHLQYVGVSYELFVEGQDVNTLQSHSTLICNCPYGNVNCVNHPPTRRTWTTGEKSHDRNGYAYPALAYYDFETAGTGLKVFEGPFSSNMKLSDVSLILNYLVVTNYDVDAVRSATSDGEWTDGGKNYDNPVAKYENGGYVVVDLNSTNELKSTKDMYEVETVIDDDISDKEKYRYLYRIAPTKGPKVYPESRESEAWKPYYAGCKVKFVKYHNGYFYIALTKDNVNYELVETDTLFAEKELVQTNGNVAISGIRFFDDTVVVEYENAGEKQKLQWFYSGMNRIRHLLRSTEYDGSLALTPQTVRVGEYNGNVILDGGSVYVHFEKPSDGQAVASAIECEYNIYRETKADRCIIDSDEPSKCELVYSTQYRGNYLSKYNSDYADADLDSEFDNKDESVPLSGIHSVNDELVLFTDDAYSETSRGNGVKYRKPNGAITDAMLLASVENTESAYADVAFSVNDEGSVSAIANVASNVTYENVRNVIDTFTKNTSTSSWTASSDDVSYSYSEMESLFGLKIDEADTSVNTIYLSSEANGRAFGTTAIDRNCCKFVNAFELSGTTADDRRTICTVFDRTNRRILISPEYDDVEGRSYDSGTFFVEVGNGGRDIVDCVHVEMNDAEVFPGCNTTIDRRLLDAKAVDLVIVRNIVNGEAIYLGYLIDYLNVDDAFVKPYAKIPSSCLIKLDGYSLPCKDGSGDYIPPIRVFLSDGHTYTTAEHHVYVDDSEAEVPSGYEFTFERVVNVYGWLGKDGKGVLLLTRCDRASDGEGESCYVYASVKTEDGSCSFVYGGETQCKTDISDAKTFTKFKFNKISDDDNQLNVYDDKWRITGRFVLGQDNGIYCGNLVHFKAVAVNPYVAANCTYTMYDTIRSTAASGDRNFFTLCGRTSANSTTAKAYGVSGGYTLTVYPKANIKDKLGYPIFATNNTTTTTLTGLSGNYGRFPKTDSELSLKNENFFKASGCRYISAISFNPNGNTLFSITDVSRNNDSGQIEKIICKFDNVDENIPLFKISTLITSMSSYTLSGQKAKSNNECVGAAGMYTKSYNEFGIGTDYDSKNGGPKNLNQPVYVNISSSLLASDNATGSKTYTFSTLNAWKMTCPYSGSSTSKMVMTCEPTSDNKGVHVRLEVVTPSNAIKYYTTGSKVISGTNTAAKNIQVDTLSGFFTPTANINMNKTWWLSSYTVSYMTLSLTADSMTTSFNPKASGSIPLTSSAGNLPISNSNEYQFAVLQSASMGEAMSNMAAVTSASDEKWTTIAYSVADSQNVNFIDSDGTNLVVGIGNGGLRYADTTTFDKVATGYTNMLTLSSEFTELATSVVDHRTSDYTNTLDLDIGDSDGESSSVTYDNVEAVYSMNRFTSHTMHKANLFSVRIDNLGIEESPYLTDLQKEQISNWIRNHVTEIVDSIKPAQTELFKVMLD